LVRGLHGDELTHDRLSIEGRARLYTRSEQTHVNTGARAMKDEARSAIEGATKEVQKTTQAVAGQACNALSDVRSYAEPLMDQVQAGYRQVADRAQEGLRDVNKFVRENPAPSIVGILGIGLGLGVIIGLSMGSRRY